jgi:multidrug efflux pump
LSLNNSNISLSGINPKNLVNELYAANNGVIVGTMLDSNKEIPIRLKGINKPDDILGSASYLTIPAQNGFEYIDSFGESRITNKSSIITRQDGQRMNSVEGWVWTGTLSSATEDYIKDDVEKFKNELPPGYSIKQLGEAETRGESQASLIFISSNLHDSYCNRTWCWH